jgi:hypothetical protein
MGWISINDTFLTQSQQLNNAQLVINHFIGKWSPQALCALCGNMSHESSINPDMHELGYGDSPSRGYGLVQWTPMTKYTNWAASVGLNYTIGDSQLARIDYEVDNNIQWIAKSAYGYMSFAQFRANAGDWSIDYLTEAFMWSYERPNTTAGQNSLPSRKSFANLCASALDWSGSGGGVAPDPSGQGGALPGSADLMADYPIYHLWLSGVLKGGI